MVMFPAGFNVKFPVQCSLTVVPLSLVSHPQGRSSIQALSGCSVTREGLMEALLLLYQECSSPELMKIKHVAKFVNKCELYIFFFLPHLVHISKIDINTMIVCLYVLLLYFVCVNEY